MDVKVCKSDTGFFIIVDGRLFKGNTVDDVKRRIIESDVLEHIKKRFKTDRGYHLFWPRGNVRYDKDHWTIVVPTDTFDEVMLEQVTREFHIPPVASDKVEVVYDDKLVNNHIISVLKSGLCALFINDYTSTAWVASSLWSTTVDVVDFEEANLLERSLELKEDDYYSSYTLHVMHKKGDL